jgi:hypothetical protein
MLVMLANIHGFFHYFHDIYINLYEWPKKDYKHIN